MPSGSTYLAVALILGGAIISLTGIGLLVGVPMILLGLVVFVLGSVLNVFRWLF